MTRPGLSRRRFLAIAASCAVAGPARAKTTTRWRGIALGAEAEITLHGPEEAAGPALQAARTELRRIERLFSLYDPASDLARLNRDGRLDDPAPDFHALLDLCSRVHAATGGLFDPSVQPLWRAMANHRGAPPRDVLEEAQVRVGWDGVVYGRTAVRLTRPGMALTFNGIAQGFATDRVAGALARFGFEETLVNIGEFRAGAGSWRIGIADPDQGLVTTRSLERGAMATSSPAALVFGGGGLGHILDPGFPLREASWSTVSVEAESAALADAFSTALCLLDAPAVQTVLAANAALKRIVLVDRDGDVATLV
ncbi:FAD:protein FMN transferase [Pelagibius sp.]|uniref:FAD:protein FMN transferase n=1 Tax=Pelagibius sp. TaxID=1931238 RepID=UPI002601B016|nr:FAD:protein FMN transferase [Pelagibius sp.]